jgi:hypothetical protein
VPGNWHARCGGGEKIEITSKSYLFLLYKTALCNNASSIICFHNHPSGDPNCSEEDVQITQRLLEAGELLGIQLLDHVIIGEGIFFSLKKRWHKTYCALGDSAFCEGRK